MIGVKVAGSRERKKNKQHMKQYCANKEASKDTEGKEVEVVQEEVDVVEMVVPFSIKNPITQIL